MIFGFLPCSVDYSFASDPCLICLFGLPTCVLTYCLFIGLHVPIKVAFGSQPSCLGADCDRLKGIDFC